MHFVRSDKIDAIRRRLDHPVIDADGHLIEFYPVVRDFLVEEAGEDVAARLDAMMSGSGMLRAVPHEHRHTFNAHRYTWWGLPASNTLDRATSMAPDLMYARLDELGIDYAILYGTSALGFLTSDDQEVRCAGARAFNRYYAEVFGGHRDRMEPVAVIPMVEPDEALAELDHAVGTLGLKAIVMNGIAFRPIPGAEGVRGARWVDTLGHDSERDYDPVWARCEELGVSPTFHHAGLGWGSHVSRTNYAYNQIGHFAAAGEATCRALFFGGVPKRFPKLRFAFLEGGVAWALGLFAGILGVHEKRNGVAIERLDPRQIDEALLRKLLVEYGGAPIRERVDRLEEGWKFLNDPDDPGGPRDEFAESGVSGPEEIAELFTRRFYFGCEADDPMNALAFTRNINPHGAELQAVFASDIGHWDVQDFREVLPEAWELVEDGALDERQFRAFTFGNAVSLMSGANPNFFDGSMIEDAAKQERAGHPAQ